MSAEKRVNVPSIYRKNVRPDRIRDEVAVACAAELSRTHKPIGGVATSQGVRISEMRKELSEIDPFGLYPNAIIGPFVDPKRQVVFPGSAVSLWAEKEPEDSATS